MSRARLMGLLMAPGWMVKAVLRQDWRLAGLGETPVRVSRLDGASATSFATRARCSGRQASHSLQRVPSSLCMIAQLKTSYH